MDSTTPSAFESYTVTSTVLPLRYGAFALSYPLVSTVSPKFIACVSWRVSTPSTILSSVAVTPIVWAEFQLAAVNSTFVPPDPPTSIDKSAPGLVISSTTFPVGCEFSTTVYVMRVPPSTAESLDLDNTTPNAFESYTFTSTVLPLRYSAVPVTSYPLVSSVRPWFIACVSWCVSLSTTVSSVAVTPTVCGVSQFEAMNSTLVPTDPPTLIAKSSALGFVMSTTTFPVGFELSTTVYVIIEPPSIAESDDLDSTTPSALTS